MQHFCQFCLSEKKSLKSLRSHETLCIKNPLCKKTPFQNKNWQKSKATNRFIKAKKEGRSVTVTEETKLKLRLKALERPKKPNDGSLRYYRSLCSFKFNVYNYPEEFDLSLIEQLGFYSAKNKGNNANGISRDHMLSVKYGYLNKIDPKIISHPANCKLITQSNNASKSDGCTISLENLLNRIEEWNLKYNLRGQSIDGNAPPLQGEICEFDSRCLHQSPHKV